MAKVSHNPKGKITMRTSLKIEEDLGYTGNADAKSRRDHALCNIVMTVSSIISSVVTGGKMIHTTEYQEQDRDLTFFLRTSSIFREMSGADRVAFHIREASGVFVLRINVSKGGKSVYRVELMFGLKNSFGDRHFTGFVESIGG
jgi:hypothetical protein